MKGRSNIWTSSVTDSYVDGKIYLTSKKALTCTFFASLYCSPMIGACCHAITHILQSLVAVTVTHSECCFLFMLPS